MHEDLFRATALSSTETFAPLGKIVNPLIGISVKLPDTCKHCTSDLAVIGEAPIPHRASLHCRECQLFRGWVSNEAFRFVSKSWSSSASRLSRSLSTGASQNRKMGVPGEYRRTHSARS